MEGAEEEEEEVDSTTEEEEGGAASTAYGISGTTTLRSKRLTISSGRFENEGRCDPKRSPTSSYAPYR